ncbi:MAG: MATE family efflux transporter, partial [Syntrophomonadaceae bacterium]|nr:MATE family efflux transporter [Syntrophomonadaceae bacterium]
MNRHDLANMSVGRLLLRLSFPPMVGMVVYSMLSIIDTFFVAKLGSAALAALTITIPIQVLMITCAAATGVGLTSLISRTLGGGNIKLADNIAWHGIILSVFYGFVFAFIGNYYMDDLLILFGCTPETFFLSKEFLQVILTGCIFTFIPMNIGNIIQGKGNTFLPIIISVFGIALNVLLDPIFIFGVGFFEGLGLKGAAVATVCAQFINTLIVIGIVIRRRALLTWSIKRFKPSLAVIYGIYKVGIPTMFIDLTGVFIMAVLNRILAGFSYTAIAALGIFLRVRSLIYMPVYGLQQGTMPIAGFAYGAGNTDRVKEVIIKASVLSFIYMSFICFILHQYPVWIVDFFSDDPALTIMGVTALKLATLTFPLMGPLHILYTVLQALGKGVTVMCLSIIRQIVFFLPLLLILPKYYNLNGIWLSFSLSEFLCTMVAFIVFVNLWRELQT